MKKTDSLNHPIIDHPDFIKDFSRVPDPAYPEEVRFWATSSEAQKAAAMRSNPDMWRTGQGRNYLEALSKVRSVNARNLYWLPILEKEMRESEDMDRLAKVSECLLSYKDRSADYRKPFNVAEPETAWVD